MHLIIKFPKTDCMNLQGESKSAKMARSGTLTPCFINNDWELDCEEGWAPKNWCFWTVVLQKTLESPLDCKEIQPVHSEGDQPWDFFGRNDAKDETLVLWPPHEKSWLIGKDSDAGRDWGQEEKGTTEDEMAGWHHWLDGCESEWTLGVGDGQGGLACCDSWGRKESDTTEWLNWTEAGPIWQGSSQGGGLWPSERQGGPRGPPTCLSLGPSPNKIFLLWKNTYNIKAAILSILLKCAIQCL